MKRITFIVCVFLLTATVAVSQEKHVVLISIDGNRLPPPERVDFTWLEHSPT